MQLKSAFNRQAFMPFVLLGGAVFLISLLMRLERHTFGLHGPDTYWATVWAVDYSHGFVNRGLLGAALRLLQMDNSGYLTLTVIAWTVCVVLYVMLLVVFWRLMCKRPFGMRTALAFALLLSPAISGILIETLGDPLQFVLLMHLSLAFIFLERPVKPRIVGVVYAIAGVLTALIQEASIFLILPWLGMQAFLARRSPQAMAAMIGASVTSVAVVAFIIVNGFSAEAIRTPALHFGQEQVIYEGRIAPAFKTLLAEETHRMFGRGLAGYFDTGLRILGAALVPVIAVIVLTAVRLGTGANGAKLWREHAIAYAVSLIGLLPLLLIAHDWGRFIACHLMLFMWTMTGWNMDKHEARYPIPLMLPLAGFSTVAGLANTPDLDEYRMDGLFANAHILLETVLIIAIFGVLAFIDRSDRPKGA